MFAIPPIKDYFRSFYYSQTFLPPVDLTKTATRFSCPYQGATETTKSMVGKPEIRNLLCQPLNYEISKISQNIRILKENGFTSLGSKPLSDRKTTPYYNVVSHPDLVGWVIKATGSRISSESLGHGQKNDQGEVCRLHPQESLLRLTMNQRMRQAARELNIPMQVPEEYFVPLDGLSGVILSKQLDFLSAEETADAIGLKSWSEQERLADQCCSLIQKIGYPDATLENIRLTKDGILVFVDTEPGGALVGVDEKPQSVEKCARVGLYTLKMSAAAYSLDHFAKRVNDHYQNSLRNYSITRIVLSILCPLLPLIFLVISIVNTYRIQFLVQKTGFKDNLSLQKRYFSLIEGVPFNPSNFSKRRDSETQRNTEISRVT